jgi:hypothetical protein
VAEQFVPPCLRAARTGKAVEATGVGAQLGDLQSEIRNLKSSEAWSRPVLAHASPSVATKR